MRLNLDYYDILLNSKPTQQNISKGGFLEFSRDSFEFFLLNTWYASQIAASPFHEEGAILLTYPVFLEMFEIYYLGRNCQK